MRKFIILGTLLLTGLLSAQSFQWGKRGGATDQLETTSNLRQEEVYDIVTDSQRNIYILSAVGKTALDIDGVDKVNFGDYSQITDVALASFACDGTYRWSKIIGGKGNDIVNSLEIDSQDNIYIAGRFGNCGDAAYPPRIDDDVVISQTPMDCSTSFLAKYNSNGVMQWFKRPQPIVNSISAFSMGLSVDNSGNSYWLMLLPAGTYADGSFVNTLPGRNLFILKYAPDGTFISQNLVDMQVSNGGGLLSLAFYRNPYNGYFYITSTKGDSSETAVVGGQVLNHTVFISCFNESAQFQWVREDTATTPGALQLYNLDFDSDNNIYLAGRLVGINSDSMFGLIIPEPIAPGFVMKIDPLANTVFWSSHSNKATNQRGAIALNGNELGFTSICGSTNFSWGTQTINVNNANEGWEVLLARFDKTTGACNNLSRIQGEVGYNDGGTALAVDANGDYIIGGFAGRQLSFTTNTLTATGIQSDFFVAKYSTSPCSLGQDEFDTGKLLLYPNPATDVVTMTTTENRTYQVYDLMGNAVLNGNLSEENNTIDLAVLSAGCYLVVTVTVDGVVQRGKLVKK